VLVEFLQVERSRGHGWQLPQCERKQEAWKLAGCVKSRVKIQNGYHTMALDSEERKGTQSDKTRKVPLSGSPDTQDAKFGQ
jgi:hypothetical protein